VGHARFFSRSPRVTATSVYPQPTDRKDAAWWAKIHTGPNTPPPAYP